MSTEWQIRLYLPKDKQNLVKWRELVGRRKKTEEFIEWEYFSSPNGPVETWFAVNSKQIIGQYSLQRYQTYYQGSLIRASLVFDVSTHPDYRNQGIFTKLGFHSLENEGKENISFSTGFPNEQALPGHVTVGWTILGKLPLYRFQDFKNYKFSKAISGIKILNIDEFDDRFDTFMEKHKDDLPLILNRDSKYLNWRFCQKIDYHYDCFQILDENEELIGYFILKQYESEEGTIIHIIDYILDVNQSIFKTMLDMTVKIAIEKDASFINLMINDKLPFFNFLAKIGFKQEDTDRVYIVHKNDDCVSEDILYDFSNYYITMADSDIY